MPAGRGCIGYGERDYSMLCIMRRKGLQWWRNEWVDEVTGAEKAKELT